MGALVHTATSARGDGPVFELPRRDRVTDHLDELRGTAWDGCTLQHLLDMRVGVRWDGEVDEYTLLDVSD